MDLNQEEVKPSSIRRYSLLLLAAWTVLVVCSMLWQVVQHRNEALYLAKMQCQAFFEKDVLYRRWASVHGGVYVPVTESTKPNPHLAHISERDLTTPSGKKLTLINPAYMTRQVFELAQEYTGTGRGHITSLNPLRPENVPDPWERKALAAFYRGAEEVGECSTIGGKPYYRYMKRLVADKSCLKCHAAQGYREGEVRGGLSVSVSMEPFYALTAQSMRQVTLTHSAIWLLVAGFLGAGARKLERSDLRIRRQSELLRKEKKRSDQYLNVVQVIMVAFDNEARVTLLNRKGYEVLGYAEGELEGKDWFRTCLPAEEWERVRAVYQHMVAGDVKPFDYYENHILTKGGDRRLIGWRNTLIKDENGRIIGTLSSGEDITERRIVEEEREKLERQLYQSQKMEAIGQLAGGVAHDFNNLLTVIIGYANLLAMGKELAPHQKEAAEQIFSAAEKAAQLTRGLLAFSRKQPLIARNANLNDIISHVEKFLVRIIGEDIHFRSTYRSQMLPVCVDSGQIEQTLINLITNARDAMPKGGVLTVETGICQVEATDSQEPVTPGRYACISVSDNGCGMDRQTCARIFEPFFTTKEVGKGTGLGMAIVFGIIRQHNGFINVYSEPGVGTIFRIYLPLVEAVQAGEVEGRGQETPRGGTETILVAEDDAQVRQLVTATLTNFGYLVIEAGDGQAAVERFAEHKDRISLLFFDMIMPKKSGKDAYEEISLLQPDVKVLYSSGYTADFIQERGVEEKGLQLIMKPVQPMELLRKVREILDR